MVWERVRVDGHEHRTHTNKTLSWAKVRPWLLKRRDNVRGVDLKCATAHRSCEGFTETSPIPSYTNIVSRMVALRLAM